MKILVSSLIIASVLVLFLDLLNPLDENQRTILRIFDLSVVVIWGIDFAMRLKSSQNKPSFIPRHLYEFRALVPPLVTGAYDGSSILYYIKLIALFRVIRLYNIMLYVDGSELIILASMSGVSILFGGFAIYIVEAGQPGSNINNILDAMRCSIETITTETYREYHPVTHSGRLIGSLIMFISIAFLWTFVGLLGSRIIANRITRNQEKNIRITDYSSKPTSVIQETKSIVKRRIDEIETLGKGDLDELIALIRLLNSGKKIS